MSQRSARKWQCGPLPSETKTERRWRTRPDPFDGVWEEEILPLLRGEAAGRLRATTIIEWLEEKSPGRFSTSQLRTLQRRLQDWRALNGPDQEVYFPQEHPPGREAQLDFTHCNSLGVTIGGRRYRHLLFQLVLSHSGWRYAEVVAGETFVALKQGLQNALWELGGAPQVIRSDNSSARTHEIKRSRGRALNDNYAELLEHYGLEATLINSGESHENGVAEQAHYRLKDALDRALMLRGSRDFDSAESYTGFVRKVVERRNRLVQGKLEQERPRLQCLPPAPVPEYVNHQARVRKWSTIQAAGRTYTVPSRLIGKEVQIRLYAERLEVYYKGHLVERMERVRGRVFRFSRSRNSEEGQSLQRLVAVVSQRRRDIGCPGLSQQPQCRVAQGRHHLGRRPAPHLGCVLFHGHVPHVMQPVLDLPMAPPQAQQLLGPSLSWTQTGDGLGQLLSGRSLTGHLALHTAHLPYLGPVQILIEGGGGPQGTLFPTVAVPPALPSRGQLFPPRVVRQTAGQYRPAG